MIPLRVGKAVNLSQYTAKAWAGGGNLILMTYSEYSLRERQR